MSKTFIGTIGLAAVSLFASGCLIKDTTQTVYLEPNGTVTWSVLEKDVRSDAPRAEDRAREETAFIAAATADRHPIATAFARLYPSDLRTVIVRSGRPFTVLTEARFTRLDTLMADFGAATGMTSTSVLEGHDAVLTWTWIVHEEDNGGARDDVKAVAALADSFEGCQFVLSTGRFIRATGFELSSDNRVATLHVPGNVHGTGGADPLLFSLTWTSAEGQR
jgi:hypothetical protein